ncbi:MAG: hypothetical protein P4L61_00865 [Candidatus Pacebacteria bacterium]|nr:hypothetical protein [Candidatus Paceibacterota bacterium]
METQLQLFPTPDGDPKTSKKSRNPFEIHIDIYARNGKIFLGENNGKDFKGLAYFTRNDLLLLNIMFESGRFKKFL